MFERKTANPILSPNSTIPWKAKAVYNPAAIILDGKIHLVYRGQALNGVSRLGYAVSRNGVLIDEDLSDPIYSPRESFEMQTKDGWNSGCEDPRITQIDDMLYMTYTAYDGTNPPRVALTSILVDDFLSRNWSWEKPRLITPPGQDDKDACIIRSKNNKYYGFHRLGNVIWIDELNDLSFPDVRFLSGNVLAQARSDMWDNVKIGIGAPPIETNDGFILFYHAVSNPGFSYKIGAFLLSNENPHNIIGRTSNPLLEPSAEYEKNGQVPNMVFTCGAVVMDQLVYLYYGGADTVVGVATIKLDELLGILKNQSV